ncbi:MAG: hypothetical protein HC915_19105 [Anaerolineae bacterium]|nr:hypothetical protein [Anaerolineae bacterium]
MQPVESRWIVEGKIICNRFDQVMNLEAMRHLTEHNDAFNAQYPNRHLHYILDLRQVTKIDLGVRDLQHLREQIGTGNIGWVLALLKANSPQNALIQMVGAMATKIFNIRYRSFYAPEAVLAFLQPMDDTLPDLNPYAALLQNTAATR